MDKNPRNGRNPFEGYVRGCGIQFGNIPQLCDADPDFRTAIQLAQGRTMLHPANLMNLFMLIKFYLAQLGPGNIVEFGSYQGGSAIFMAYLARRLLPNVNVYSFDTFEGMPPTDRKIDIHQAGDFKQVNLVALRDYVAEIGLSNLHFIEGQFEDSLPKSLPSLGAVTLAHIDCDIYSAVAYTYDTIKPVMAPGGYIVLDDPQISTCLGAMEAMEELLIRRDGLHAEQAYPQPVFRYPPI